MAVLSVIVYHVHAILGVAGSKIFSYIHYFGLFGVSLFFIVSIDMFKLRNIFTTDEWLIPFIGLAFALLFCIVFNLIYYQKIEKSALSKKQ